MQSMEYSIYDITSGALQIKLRGRSRLLVTAGFAQIFLKLKLRFLLNPLDFIGIQKPNCIITSGLSSIQKNLSGVSIRFTITFKKTIYCFVTN